MLINTITKMSGQSKKTKPISYYKSKADKLFSKFIRKRDAENGGSCISCGKWFPYEQMDAGHFISRNCYQLRYDERNVNAQCLRCNRFANGEQALYARGLDAKYGKGTADRLLKVYQQSKSNIEKFSIDFYKDIIKKYDL